MNKSTEESNLTRRKFLKLTAAGGLAGAAALTFGLRPWQKQAAGSTRTVTRPAMGTFVEITGVGKKAVLSSAMEEAFLRVNQVEKTMSVFDQKSDVYKLNVPANRRLTLDPDLAQVIERSLGISEMTEGSFDITASPLMDLWGFYSQRLTVPTPSRIEETLGLVDYSTLDVNTSTNVLTLSSPRQAIDLGGVAKGYAVDQAIDALKEGGLTGGLVNAGGDIRGFGKSSTGSDWRVGLQHPKDQKKLLTALDLTLPAITTSGDYESFFTYGGDRLAHIIDPKTGRPVEDVLSVSIMTKDATTADGLSTGLFSQDPNQAVNTVNSLTDTELIYIHEREGSVEVVLSSGLQGEVDKRKMEMKLN